MTTDKDHASALNRFFTGLSEHVFHTRLGVVDTQLIDYISGLLIRFNRFEHVQRVRLANGQFATEVVAMVKEAEKRIGEAKREVHRHIGDFTLFWSGLYPEALRSLQSQDREDYFIKYCDQGKRAYLIASTIESREKTTSNELLARISQQYDMCAYGLREVRREWERRDQDGEAGLLL